MLLSDWWGSLPWKLDTSISFFGSLHDPVHEGTKEMVVCEVEDADLEAMSTYFKETKFILQAELEKFIRAGAGEPSTSLKRILDTASQESQLFPIPRDNQASSSGSGGWGQICRHTCEHHEELMDLSRWGKLSRNILFQIFARLPLSKIIALQSHISWLEIGVRTQRQG